MAHRNYRRQDQSLGKVLRRHGAYELRQIRRHIRASLDNFVQLIGFEDPQKQVRAWFRSRGLHQEVQHG